MVEVKEDMEFARRVLSGDEKACKKFVDNYTDWVLYKIWLMMKSHCPYSASEYACSLLTVWRQRKGNAMPAEGLTQCDECMDSYIWLMEYLKKRLESYKGKNNCGLRTYMWSIINSSYMYNDWLRWKYGRAY